MFVNFSLHFITSLTAAFVLRELIGDLSLFYSSPLTGFLQTMLGSGTTISPSEWSIFSVMLSNSQAKLHPCCSSTNLVPRSIRLLTLRERKSCKIRFEEKMINRGSTESRQRRHFWWRHYIYRNVYGPDSAQHCSKKTSLTNCLRWTFKNNLSLWMSVIFHLPHSEKKKRMSSFWERRKP